MTCYFQKDNNLFIIGIETHPEILLPIENAIITKGKKYWKVSPVQSGVTLTDQHYFIVNGEEVRFYCNFCTQRLVAITSGCQSCQFQSMKSFGIYNLSALILSLRSHFFYEVDEKNFSNVEIVNKKS